MVAVVDKSDDEWRKTLSPEQYRVLRQKGTECAFSGALFNEKRKGAYHCAACGNILFNSTDKFDSRTGWPSFKDSAGNTSVDYKEDNAHGMKRTEVICSNCGGHLGHVFNDGPKPTGLRYCINSAALKFKEEK
jgi:peptide-methionine (R)-S-oxide reductase